MLKKLKRVFKAQRKRARVPRGPRLEIHPLSGILFSLEDPRYPRIDFEVVNLSEDGIGLCNAPVIKRPSAGSRLSGTMVLPGGRCKTELVVVHASATTIGCSFPQSSGIRTQVQQLFALELSAMNLIEVPAGEVKATADGTVRRFRSRNNCELIFVEQDQAIVRFQLSFFGNYIEGGAGLKTKFGFLTATSLVRLVPALSSEVLKSARRFLDHVPQLSPFQRAYLQKSIK
ncbi:MAG: hypothetical protein HY074_01835 [Deltaproteobacteria bacterium]|nr:hypothetical protein [Deltaproteobacteria bacterium]